MTESQYPNDIMMATISAPNAGTTDLLQNNITADNTLLLTPDEYKKLPFIQKTFTNKDGVFQNDQFEAYYAEAATKWSDLQDEVVMANVQKEFKYDPDSFLKPIGSESRDVSTSMRFIQNPMELKLSVTDFNKWEAPTKTPEELAQGNLIYDPENDKWLDYTPETMSLKDKVFGAPLRYAKYDKDTLDEQTGQMHYKGEFKTDKNGRFYTEIMPVELQGESQMVLVTDILSSEDSAWNKIDFLDSDGYTKSVAGTAAKFALLVVPYCLPYVGPILGAITMATGTAMAMPTLYKAFSSLAGDSSSSAYKAATAAENWTKKWGMGQSYEGRSSLFSFEGITGMVGEVFGQIHQQRAAAGLSKLFKPVKGKMGDPGYWEALSKQSKLGESLSLGYMALTSASNTFNEAKNAGYSDREAGLTALMTTGALYGIMKYNAGARGVGTWFLDKTTGYHAETNAKGLFKAFKPIFDDAAKHIGEIDGVGKKAVGSAFKNFLQKAKYNSFGIWTGAISEGIEEVSEEVIQDTVKGMMDAAAALGWTSSKESSFGGWSNVFSKEGAERYAATLLGGALGGAIFDIQRNHLPGMDPSMRVQDLSVVEYILNGQTDQLVDEVRRFGKAIDTKRAPVVTKVAGLDVPVMTSGKTAVLAAVETTIQRIRTMEKEVDIAKLYMPRGTTYEQMVDLLSEEINRDGNAGKFSEYMSQDFAQVISDYSLAARALNSAIGFDPTKKGDKQNTSPSSSVTAAERKALEDKFTAAQLKLEHFWDGERSLKYTLEYNLHKQWQNGLGLFEQTKADPNFKPFAENVAQYSWYKYGKDYKDLPDTSTGDELSKARVDKEFGEFSSGLSMDEFNEHLAELSETYLRNAKILGKHLKELTDDNVLSALSFWNTAFDQDSDGNIFGKNDPLFNLTESGSEQDVREWLDRIAVKLMKSSPMGYNVSERVSTKVANTLMEILIKVNTRGVELNSDQEADLKTTVTDLINQILSRSIKDDAWTEKDVDTLILAVLDTINDGPLGNPYVKKILEIIASARKKTATGAISTVTAPVYLTKEGAVSKILSDLNTIRVLAVIDMLETTSFVSEDGKRIADNFISKVIDPLILKAVDLQSIAEYILPDWQAASDSERAKALETARDYVLQVVHEGIKQGGLFLDDAGVKALFNGSIDDNVAFVLSKDNLDANSELTTLMKRSDFTVAEKLLKLDYLAKEKKDPIKAALKELIKKEHYNDKAVDLFEYLFEKEGEINSLLDLAQFNLSPEEVKEIMGGFKRSFILFMSLLEGARERHIMFDEFGIPTAAPSGINSFIRDYAKAFNQDGLAEDLISINDATFNLIRSKVAELDSQLDTLANIMAFNLGDKMDRDISMEKSQLRGLPKFYEQLLEKANCPVKRANYIPDDPENIDELRQKMLLYAQDIYNWFVTLNDSQKQSIVETAILNVIADNHDAFNNYFSSQDAVIETLDPSTGEYTHNINPYFGLMKFLLIISEPTKTLHEKHLGFFDTNSSVSRRFDQQLMALLVYAQLRDSGGWFKLALDKMYLAYTLAVTDQENGTRSGLPLTEGVVQSPFVFLSGTGGCGKSSVISRCVVEMLKSDGVDIESTALLSEKAKEFATQLGMTEADANELWADSNNIWKKLGFNDLTYTELSNFRSKVVEDLKKGIDLSTDLTYTDFINDNTKNDPIIIDHTITEGNNTATVKIKCSKQGSGVAISLLGVDVSFSKDIQDSIDLDLKSKKLLTVLDESTLLDLVTLSLLKQLGDANSDLQILILGDEFQHGYTIKINDNQHICNTNKYYSKRSPYMVEPIRGANTGVTRNAAITATILNCGNNGNPIVSPLISGDITSNVVDVVENNLAPRSPYVYKTDADILMGLRIVNSNEADTIKNIVNTLKTKRDAGKTLGILVLDGSKFNNSALKSALDAAGFKDGEYTVYDEAGKNNNIQGTEADFVIVYNIEKSENKLDIDVDLQRIHTYATRGKEFTLVIEDNAAKGLFSGRGFISKLDKTLFEDNSPVTNAATINPAYKNSIWDTLQGLKVEVPASTAGSTTSSTAGSTTSSTAGSTTSSTAGSTTSSTAGSTTSSTAGSTTSSTAGSTTETSQADSKYKQIIQKYHDHLAVFDRFFTYLGDGIITKDCFDADHKLLWNKVLNNVKSSSNTDCFIGYLKACGIDPNNLTEDELKTNIDNYKRVINSQTNVSSLDSVKLTPTVYMWDKILNNISYEGSQQNLLYATVKVNGQTISAALGVVRFYDADGKLTTPSALSSGELKLPKTDGLLDLLLKGKKESSETFTIENGGDRFLNILQPVTSGRRYWYGGQNTDISRGVLGKLGGKLMSIDDFNTSLYRIDGSCEFKMFNKSKDGWTDFVSWVKLFKTADFLDEEHLKKMYGNVYYTRFWVAARPMWNHGQLNKKECVPLCLIRPIISNFGFTGNRDTNPNHLSLILVIGQLYRMFSDNAKNHSWDQYEDTTSTSTTSSSPSYKKLTFDDSSGRAKNASSEALDAVEENLKSIITGIDKDSKLSDADKAALKKFIQEFSSYRLRDGNKITDYTKQLFVKAINDNLSAEKTFYHEFYSKDVGKIKSEESSKTIKHSELSLSEYYTEYVAEPPRMLLLYAEYGATQNPRTPTGTPSPNGSGSNVTTISLLLQSLSSEWKSEFESMLNGGFHTTAIRSACNVVEQAGISVDYSEIAKWISTNYNIQITGLDIQEAVSC